MKLSTKGRYGLRAMVDLALNAEEGHLALSAIADRQNISMQYLEQVFSILRKAELVRSVKGANGGYSLMTPASKITVGSILKALEGNLSIVGNRTESEDGSQNPIEQCIRESLWDKIDENINTFIESITLADLAENTRNYTVDSEIMFHI